MIINIIGFQGDLCTDKLRWWSWRLVMRLAPVWIVWEELWRIFGPKFPQIPLWNLWMTMWQIQFMLIWWWFMLSANFVTRAVLEVRQLRSFLRWRWENNTTGLPVVACRSRRVRSRILLANLGFRGRILLRGNNNCSNFPEWCKQFA